MTTDIENVLHHSGNKNEKFSFYSSGNSKYCLVGMRTVSAALWAAETVLYQKLMMLFYKL